jgi:hypothetical protein
MRRPRSVDDFSEIIVCARAQPDSNRIVNFTLAALQKTRSIHRHPVTMKKSRASNRGDARNTLNLYSIDEQQPRAFFLMDLDSMVVEITDFRVF